MFWRRVVGGRCGLKCIFRSRVMVIGGIWWRRGWILSVVVGIFFYLWRLFRFCLSGVSGDLI